MFLIIDCDVLYQFHQNAAVQARQVLVGLEIFNPRQMFHIQIVQAIPLAVHFCFGLTDSFNLFIKGMAELFVLLLADDAIAHILIKLAAQGLIFLFFLLQHFHIYKDNADTIVGNCDTTLFLGGKEKTTLKEMSEILGIETIDSFNTSETRGRELSHGLNYQKLGKQLMSEDEIAVMDGGKCILQLRGVRPFFSEKYDITKHPKYKYLSDFDKENAFDMEKHLRRRPAIVKPDEVFDYYEVDEADLQEDTE